MILLPFLSCDAGYTGDIKGSYQISDIHFYYDNCRLQDAESVLYNLTYQLEASSTNRTNDTGYSYQQEDSLDELFDASKSNIWDICYTDFPKLYCNHSLLSIYYEEWKQYPLFQDGCIAEISTSNISSYVENGLFISTNRFIVTEQLNIQCGSSTYNSNLHCNSQYSIIFDKTTP